MNGGTGALRRDIQIPAARPISPRCEIQTGLELKEVTGNDDIGVYLWEMSEDNRLAQTGGKRH